MAVLSELVTEEDAECFTRNDGELMKKLLGDASRWFRRLSRSQALGAKTAYLTSINKKAVQKELGRLEQRDPTLSNKTCTEPGPGAPGPGALPRLSTHATRVWFDQRVLQEWLTFEDNPGKKGDSSKGKRSRMLAVELAALLVERSLQKPGKFVQLWRAMDDDGLLKQLLQQNPNALVIEEENFFDDDRLSEMKRGGGDTPEGYCCGAGTSNLHGGVLL